jgi:hypothetical protein
VKINARWLIVQPRFLAETGPQGDWIVNDVPIDQRVRRMLRRAWQTQAPAHRRRGCSSRASV